MSNIIISEFMDQGAVGQLQGRYDTLYDPGLVDRPRELADAVRSARALIVRNRTQVRGDLLAAARKLTCIGRLGVGLDNIDLDACKARNIAVYPASGANDLSVAEYVIATALMLLRGAYMSSDQVAAGSWPRQDLIGREIGGKVLGLVGYGAIARETARRAMAFRMEIAAFDPLLSADHPAWDDARRCDLDTLLSISDVVSLHVPLTADTRHMIGKLELEAMKPQAVLINAARGGVVDEIALADALRSGHLAGAALDVFETEPLDADAGGRFSGIRNLILTPHIAGLTEESDRRVGSVTVSNVMNHLEGQR
jgi:(S)-sulfolactate dehydrogenase